MGEAKLQEEKKTLEEIAAKEAAEAEKQRLAKLEEERLQREEEEKQRKIKEEEEQLKKAAEEAEKKKKTKKKGKGKKATTAESKELPNLVANTCSDLKSKFLESLKATNDVNNKAPPPERPRGRKIIDNPFEK